MGYFEVSFLGAKEAFLKERGWIMVVKEELRDVVEKLSDEESCLVLKFARWLIEQEDELTEQELALLRRGEEQFESGEYTWWRDVKRTEV